jgi:hypothetical protein
MGKGRDRRRRKNKEPFRPARIAPPPVQPLASPEAPPEGHAFVMAPIKPKPSPRSGAIALPEPEEAELVPEFIGVGSRP